MKKRVLQVFASLDMGGAECRMMDVYRSIDRDRFDFDFVTLQDKEQFFEAEIQKLGGHVYKLSSPREVGIKRHIQDLRKCMRNGKYEAVHAHTSYHCGLVMYSAKKEGIPVRITHARTNDSIQGGLKTKAYIGFGRLMISRYATDKLAISEEAGRFLFGNTDFEVVPNSIDLEKYREINSEQIENFRREFGVIKGETVIGHVGRFDRFKNQRFVVNVFCDYLKKNTSAKLILTGDGELRHEIEQYVAELGIESKVIFTGVRSDVPVLMNCFDVLLFPSIVEGLGGVVLEAQAAGTPAVISENVPQSVDVGLGLIKRLSLDEPIDRWTDAIDAACEMMIPDQHTITNRFDRSGYTLTSSVKKYSEIYEG